MDKMLKTYVSALKQGKTVILNIPNKCVVESFTMQHLRSYLKITESTYLANGYSLIKILDSYETIPVRFNAPQELDFSSVVQATQLTVENLKNFKSNQARICLANLERKLVGLLYRLEKSNEGYQKEPKINEKEQENLLFKAEEWKGNQKTFSSKALTEKDLKRLVEVLQYPEFLKLVFKYETLAHTFFEWILRDGNAAAPFVEFPFMQEKIVDSNLNGRIARMGGDFLAIKYETLSGVQQKVLTLPIEDKLQNILDEEKEITFRGNYTLKIKEIFQIFKEKKYRVGNLEFLSAGIINWNVHHLGWWDEDQQLYQQVDLLKKDWWLELPHFETLTIEEASKRYGIALDGKKWSMAATATRGTPTLDFDGTHAFMELAIPVESGYQIYDFGKFAYVFPSSFFSSLFTFCLNMHATIAYPDENVFYTHRQHGYYAFAITEEQGLALMQKINADMQAARINNLVFQIESENCAKWLYEKLISVVGKEKVPNLFKMSLMKTQPVGFVGGLFKLLKIFPEKVQFRLLAALHIPFGAGKGTWVYENGQKVLKTLKDHEFWSSSNVYLPAFMIEQIHQGLLQVNQE